METLVVQEATQGKDESSFLNIFQSKTEAQMIGGFPVPGQQITFYMWSTAPMDEGLEIPFKVHSRTEDGRIADIILDGPAGTVSADVVYKNVTADDGTELVLKHLQNVRLIKAKPEPTPADNKKQ